MTPQPPAPRPGQVHLSLKDPKGNRSLVTAAGARLVLGRAPQAAIRLNHAKISRLHAELFRDAAGQWRVRDLHSRNGTFVNSRRVEEQPLARGDVIRIGRCELTFEPEPTYAPEAAAGMTVTVVDDTLSNLTTLQAEHAAGLSGGLVAGLLDMGDQLLGEPDHRRRRSLACALLNTPPHAGYAAMVLRLPADWGTQPVEVVAEAVREGLWNSPAVYVSRSVLAEVLRTGQAVRAGDWEGAAGDVQITAQPRDGRLTVVACPLSHGRDVREILYWILPSTANAQAMLELASAAARILRQADAAWRRNRRGSRAEPSCGTP